MKRIVLDGLVDALLDVGLSDLFLSASVIEQELARKMLAPAQKTGA